MHLSGVNTTNAILIGQCYFTTGPNFAPYFVKTNDTIIIIRNCSILLSECTMRNRRECIRLEWIQRVEYYTSKVTLLPIGILHRINQRLVTLLLERDTPRTATIVRSLDWTSISIYFVFFRDITEFIMIYCVPDIKGSKIIHCFLRKRCITIWLL